MSGGRRSRGRAAALRRDLNSIGQNLDKLYPPTDAPVNAARAAAGLEPAAPASTSIEIQAHLLGPEHLGHMIEVRYPGEGVKPGLRRPEGPLGGRLVGYRAAPQPSGPNTGTPVRAFELLIQQGPSTTTATVSWADPIRIA